MRSASVPGMAASLFPPPHAQTSFLAHAHHTAQSPQPKSAASAYALQPNSAMGGCRHVETLVSGDFRADFSKFRKMGSNKPLIVLRLLERHAFDTVIISDVDTAWLRDPGEFVLRHPTADVLISTDCLSHWLEAQHDPQAAHHTYFHRCGHLPGATYGRAFNTGVIIFRNRYAHVSGQCAPARRISHLALRSDLRHAERRTYSLSMP